MTCKKCAAAGVEEPFRGTFAELGRHAQVEHPKPRPIDLEAAGAADVPRGTLPLEGLEAPEGAEAVREDETVPGGVTITEAGPERRTWRDRLWGPNRGRLTAAAPAGPVSSTERKPARGKRASTDFIFSLGWKFIGGRLERSGADVIVGRTMVYQSPVAGAVLEKLTRGTIVDTILQPFARRADELEAAAALFTLPLLFGMLERDPQMLPLLEPFIRDAIRVHIVAMAPIIRKEKKDAADLAEVARELFPDAPEGTDPVDIVLGTIVAGTMFDPNAQPAEAADATAPAA
jgi:hypothetical protein